MRLLAPRGIVAVFLTAALMGAGLVAATPVDTASAAATRPDKVGLVSFVGASLTSRGATLSVDWPYARGAKSYEVFLSSTYEGVANSTVPRMTVTASEATLTRLSPGRDYFVQVRAVSADGVTGPRSSRVGHGTILAEADLPSGAPVYRALSWNICSNACASISTRTSVINSRIGDLYPDVVALQESSRYTKTPSGYSFAVKGQNALLVRNAQFSVIQKNRSGVATGTAKPSKKYASPGKGIAWAALKHRTGAFVIVIDAHLVTGTSTAQIAQREYEAGKLASWVGAIQSKLNSTHGGLGDWKKVPVVLLGDFNTHKQRTGDDTMRVLEGRGWYDGYDQARRLSSQHYNTANPSMSTTRSPSIIWGAHVDKVVVRPSQSVVYSWQNAGKVSRGKYAAPLGSDHHPLLVSLGLR